RGPRPPRPLPTRRSSDLLCSRHRVAREKLERLSYREVEHLGDVFLAERVVEHRGVETFSVTELAHAFHGRHHAEVSVNNARTFADRKSTRLNSSHVKTSY